MAFYLRLLVMRLEPRPMTDFPHEPHGLWPQQSLESWLIAIASALVALIAIGVLPRVLGA